MSVLHAAGWILAAAGIVSLLVLRARQARAAVRVARACHELRGPLGAARLALAALDDEAPAARVAALDLELRRAGLALEDLGAACGGRRVVGREEPIAVADLLREQLAVWDLVARALGASLVGGPDLPGVHVLGDRLRLAQAIGNLIVNALQHGGRLAPAPSARGARIGLELPALGIAP